MLKKVGFIGLGQLGKMINNIIFNCNIAVLAEVLPMAVKLGLDPEQRSLSGAGQWFLLFAAHHVISPHRLSATRATIGAPAA